MSHPRGVDDEKTVTLADPGDALNFFVGMRVTVTSPPTLWMRLRRHLSWLRFRLWHWRRLRWNELWRQPPARPLVVTEVDQAAGEVTFSTADP